MNDDNQWCDYLNKWGFAMLSVGISCIVWSFRELEASKCLAFTAHVVVYLDIYANRCLFPQKVYRWRNFIRTRPEYQVEFQEKEQKILATRKFTPFIVGGVVLGLAATGLPYEVLPK